MSGSFLGAQRDSRRSPYAEMGSDQLAAVNCTIGLAHLRHGLVTQENHNVIDKRIASLVPMKCDSSSAIKQLFPCSFAALFRPLGLLD